MTTLRTRRFELGVVAIIYDRRAVAAMMASLKRQAYVALDGHSTFIIAQRCQNRIEGISQLRRLVKLVGGSQQPVDESRTAMNRALQVHVVPALRDRGFSGSLPHFRRRAPTKTDLVSFQFDRHGGGFVIALAEAPAGEFTTSWGRVIAPDRLTALNINPPGRKRLQPGPRGSPTGWFRYDSGMSSVTVAESVLAFLGQMEAWFAGDKNQANIR
jgi:uncharacterized protein DUF4304